MPTNGRRREAAGYALAVLCVLLFAVSLGYAWVMLSVLGGQDPTAAWSERLLHLVTGPRTRPEVLALAVCFCGIKATAQYGFRLAVRWAVTAAPDPAGRGWGRAAQSVAAALLAYAALVAVVCLR